VFRRTAPIPGEQSYVLSCAEASKGRKIPC
jgi:hypothetical protein